MKTHALIKNISFLTIILMQTSTTVNAAEQLHNREIIKLYTYENSVVAKIDPPSNNTDGCTHSSASEFVGIDMSRLAASELKKGEEMYATLLAGLLSGMGVGFGVAGCQEWGTLTIPKVYRVDLN